MNDNQFKFGILVAVLIFIAVLVIATMVFIVFLKATFHRRFIDVLGELEDTVCRMSRDANISKTYLYKLGQCVQVLKDCSEW